MGLRQHEEVTPTNPKTILQLKETKSSKIKTHNQTLLRLAMV